MHMNRGGCGSTGKTEKFYEKLEETCEGRNKNNVVMIKGDFTIQIRKEGIFGNVARWKTLHERKSGNGERLCNWAAAENMFIVSTQFRHRKQYKVTWIRPGTSGSNQIDHIVMSRKWTRKVQDARSYRGANIVTQITS